MSLDVSTDPDSRPTKLTEPMHLGRARFLADLRAGLGPRIEDYLEGLDPSGRSTLLRELIIAERDWKREHGLEAGPPDYRSRFPQDSTLIDEILASPEATVTIPRRDRIEDEASLLFGLLALANGLIVPGSLIGALDAWARTPGQTLREILVERDHLNEADASIVSALATKHLEQHHGIAWESLIALGKAVRFQFDPSEIVDSELRVILAGFVDKPGDDRGRAVPGFDGRYEIVRRHASGGLGIISLARDGELNREVAVKEIRFDCADNPDYRARFLREAEVTGRLEHPGIVPVYGRGYHSDGRPYYIMRFIRGETLKAAIARLHKPEGQGEEAGSGGRPDLPALVGRFIDACHAVAYAHHRKILHRDLKPINIMLGPFGETLVVDWGLAKTYEGPRSDERFAEEGTLHPESSGELTPTRIGSHVGTLGYMSPEQAAGRLLELGPTSDIYSLGVTLYCLATGHPPFEGAGNKVEYLKKVGAGDFPTPREVNPAVPRALEAICLKAMALRPIDRYQSAEALVDDLERWRAGHPVLAYPEPPVDRLARWARKHKTAIAGLAILLACTSIGLAVDAARQREARTQVEAERSLAQAGWDAAQAGRVAAEANRRSALDSLKSTLRVVAGADLAFLARSEDVRAKMANDLVNSYRELRQKNPDDKRTQFDLAQSCQLSANIGRSMGKFERPRDLYAEAIRLLESLGGWKLRSVDLRVELAAMHDDAGENYRMAGKPKEAEREYLEGLAALRRPGHQTPAGTLGELAEARLQVDLSGASNDLGRFDKAEAASRRAIEFLGPMVAQPSSGRAERLFLVYALLGRGNTLRQTGDLAGASKVLADASRQSEELMASIADPDTRFALAAVRIEQGYLLIDGGPTTAAFDTFREACSHLEPLQAALPGTVEFQKSLASALGGRGACHLALGRLTPAREDCSKARILLERLDAANPGHFGHLELLGSTCMTLGLISKAESRPDARDLLRQAIAHHSASLAANHDSPTVKKSLEKCRDELARLEEGPATPTPRP